MKILDNKLIDDFPEIIKERLLKTYKETNEIIEEALALQKTKIRGKISFKYEHSAQGDVLTPSERAQSVCFITRYEHLPILNKLNIIEKDGNYFIANIGFIRHILNEYRSIIVNEKDSVYFSKIHTFCHLKLSNRDPSKGLSISVDHKEKGDITDMFLQILGEKNKAIKLIIDRCEYDYIYNGILQHSDHKYTKRFLIEYNSGRINHSFIKHSFLLGLVKELLYWHYRLLNSLTFPKMGPI